MHKKVNADHHHNDESSDQRAVICYKGVTNGPSWADLVDERVERP